MASAIRRGKEIDFKGANLSARTASIRRCEFRQRRPVSDEDGLDFLSARVGDVMRTSFGNAVDSDRELDQQRPPGTC